MASTKTVTLNIDADCSAFATKLEVMAEALATCAATIRAAQPLIEDEVPTDAA